MCLFFSEIKEKFPWGADPAVYPALLNKQTTRKDRVTQPMDAEMSKGH